MYVCMYVCMYVYISLSLSIVYIYIHTHQHRGVHNRRVSAALDVEVNGRATKKEWRQLVLGYLYYKHAHPLIIVYCICVIIVIINIINIVIIIISSSNSSGAGSSPLVWWFFSSLTISGASPRSLRSPKLAHPESRDAATPELMYIYIYIYTYNCIMWYHIIQYTIL